MWPSSDPEHYDEPNKIPGRVSLFQMSGKVTNSIKTSLFYIKIIIFVGTIDNFFLFLYLFIDIFYKMMIQEVHFVGKNEVHLYPAVLAIIGVFCLLIPNDSQP